MANFGGLQSLDLSQQSPPPAPVQTPPAAVVRSSRQASSPLAALISKFGGASPVRRFPISPAPRTPVRPCLTASSPAPSGQPHFKLPPRLPAAGASPMPLTPSLANSTTSKVSAPWRGPPRMPDQKQGKATQDITTAAAATPVAHKPAQQAASEAKFSTPDDEVSKEPSMPSNSECSRPSQEKKQSKADSITLPRKLCMSTPARFHGNRSGGASPFDTPTRKRQLSGASEAVRVLGAGTGGITELSRSLDDCSVSWALLRFQVGGGTFQRTKLVAIHCNGEDTPVMLRGWLNARSSEVLSLLGEVHANVTVAQVKEVTVENLCRRLLPLFASDNMNYSLTYLNEEYEKAVAQLEAEARQRRLKAETPMQPPPAAKAPEPPLKTVLTAAEALNAVAADGGSCNWALLEARTLKLHSSGYGGLEDLKAHLAEDQVLFGALRLSFGSGITKHIFVHWVGPRVSVVQRGLLNARLAQAATTIGQHFAVAFRREAHRLKDLELEDIVNELRRLTVVDGIGAADGVAASRISAAEYLAALKEETSNRERDLDRRSSSPVVKADEAPSEAAAPQESFKIARALDVKDTVFEVRKTSGNFNWVLCGWERSEPTMPPPSPCRGGA